ncbi:hypothetical protein F4778DRAFT_384516 [Xylariomycetidae sp. FL2044]|nr:hypothetical protein F4778DRAFT_384516 [Xylariomycetidae sp. FL2044]
MSCQAIINYHSCGCQKGKTVYFCSTPFCKHTNAAYIVGRLPFPCGSSTGPVPACRGENPAKKQFVREIDTAERLTSLSTRAPEPRPCKAVVNYHSCGCRQGQPIYFCGTASCGHPKGFDFVVGNLAFPCSSTCKKVPASQSEDRSKKELVRETNTAIETKPEEAPEEVAVATEVENVVGEKAEIPEIKDTEEETSEQSVIENEKEAIKAEEEFIEEEEKSIEERIEAIEEEKEPIEEEKEPIEEEEEPIEEEEDPVKAEEQTVVEETTAATDAAPTAPTEVVEDETVEAKGVDASAADVDDDDDMDEEEYQKELARARFWANLKKQNEEWVKEEEEEEERRRRAKSSMVGAVFSYFRKGW